MLSQTRQSGTKDSKDVSVATNSQEGKKRNQNRGNGGKKIKTNNPEQAM